MGTLWRAKLKLPVTAQPTSLLLNFLAYEGFEVLIISLNP
jgi:hypothetical protein